jgi:hypothetical protein
MSGFRIFRDRDGDLWALGGDGRRWYCLADESPGGWEGPAERTWAIVEGSYGPLVELTGDLFAPHIEAVSELAARIGTAPAAAEDHRPPDRGGRREVSATEDVLAEVLDERIRQIAKWGEQNHPDGTGTDTHWLANIPVSSPGWSAVELANFFRARCKANGPERDNYLDILMEEIAEAFAEDEPATLRAELVQVAAVAVQWVEAIDRRARVAGGRLKSRAPRGGGR